LKQLNDALSKETQKNLEFYTMKDVKDILVSYIAQEELEKEGETKRGHVKLDPLIVKFVGDIKPDQNQVKKEFIFKNLDS